MKKILLFLLFFLLIYSACVALFQVPAFWKSNTQLISSFSEYSFSTLLPKTYFRIGPEGGKDAVTDAVRVTFKDKGLIEQIKREAKARGQKSIDLSAEFFTVYLNSMWRIPICFLIALFLATPVAWKQRLINLLIAIPILFLLVHIKFFFVTLYRLSVVYPDVYDLNPVTSGIAYFFENSVELGATILLIMLIWVISFFRKGNWKKLIQDFADR